jgi:hypothetical protein
MSRNAELDREIAACLPPYNKLLSTAEIEKLEEGTHVMVMWPLSVSKGLHVILRREKPSPVVFAVPWAYHLEQRSFQNEITGHGDTEVGNQPHQTKVWLAEREEQSPLEIPEEAEEEPVFATMIWY